MPVPPFSRRAMIKATGVAAVAAAVGPVLNSVPAEAPTPPARADIGVSAYPFDLGQVRLTTGRWLDNQNRTLSLPAVRRRRPAALQLPRQPPAVHQRRRGERRLGRARRSRSAPTCRGTS